MRVESANDIETDQLQHCATIQECLAEKRQNLAVWLESAPLSEKELRLGAVGEEAVEHHVHAMDIALEKAAVGQLGVCKVCGENVEEALLEMDYTAEVCLTHFSAQEVSSLEHELELSRVVQRSLLPQEAPHIPGWELAAFIRPAQIVGGDFFDFLRFKDGKYGIVIGDVAGKGVAAGLIMASIQTALRTLAPESISPAETLHRVNRLYARNAHFTTFVTLFLGAYDPAKEEFTYSSAGHNPPLHLVKRNGAPEAIGRLQPTAPAIGLLEEPTIQEKSLPLAGGDLLLFYTDGVTEAFDIHGDQFGLPRLEAFLLHSAQNQTSKSETTGNGAHVAHGPRRLIRALQRELLAFIGSQPLGDDITLIAGRRVDEPGRQAPGV